MSGLNNDDDEALDNVDSLISRIKGNKKNEEAQKPKEPAAPPQPSSTGDRSATRIGDFDALRKKMEASQMDAPAPVATDPAVPARTGSSAPPHDDLEFSDADDQQEKSQQSVQMPQKPPAEPDDLTEGKDIRASLGKLLAGNGKNQPSVSPSGNDKPKEQDVIEIIDEDPKAALRSKTIKTVSSAPPAAGEQVTDADKKIINVDQISELSGLILPKGVSFKIDELKLHGRISAFEGTGTLPPDFDEIWKKNFSTTGFKDLDIATDSGLQGKKPLAEHKKFGLSRLFRAVHSTLEEYDPKKHGPLVDISFKPQPGIEEVELYPVNPPYAYIQIIYDHSTHEYTYKVLEPILTEPEMDLLKELKERLFETLDINTKDISKEEAGIKLRGAATDVILDFGIKLTPVQRETILYNMHKEFLGDGLIDAIMHDKYIEDISCDGVHATLFVYHSNYESMKTTLSYVNAEDLDSFVTKLAQRSGKYISIAQPILDSTMQDGSRIQMTLGQEVTAHGSTFTIRKFKDEPITPTDLIEWRTFCPLSIAYIWLCVENGKSAIFAGGTASGKTTALNAISLFIPPLSKIVSLEDTRELKLPHPNWIPSVTRDSFDTSGRGEINMYELLRAAMRQRPEYILVGEVRGKECQTLFQAMSTGHTTYSTTHADSVASVVHRIENPPMDVPRNMLSALDFICVQVQGRVGGKRIRRNKQIVEILDIDPRTNELITNEVFKWRSATDEITYSGKSYLLEEIMEAKGWTESRMREELKRRQEVLEWMRIKKIRHFKDVAKILISYHRDPEAVIEKVRKDLYE
jgi:archaeal flagellar protein FlaI